MKKNYLKLKDTIQFQDKVNAIEFIAGSYFTANDDGELLYTPYLTEIAQTEAIVNYFLEGVSFEEDEDIYDAVLQDEELNSLVQSFYPTEDKTYNHQHEETQNLFQFILSCVADKVAYRKQEELAKIQNTQNILLADKLIEVLEKEAKQLDTALAKQEEERRTTQKYEEWLDYQNRVAEQFTPEENAKLTRKMAEMNFDPAAVTDLLMDKYLDSELHKQQEAFAQTQDDEPNQTFS